MKKRINRWGALRYGISLRKLNSISHEPVSFKQLSISQFFNGDIKVSHSSPGCGLVWYLTSKSCQEVRWKVYEKRYSISIGNHVLFCLSHKHTDNTFLTIFGRFSNTFQNFSKRKHERFRAFFVDYWRFPKTFEEDPKMFRSYTVDLGVIGYHAYSSFVPDA